MRIIALALVMLLMLAAGCLSEESKNQTPPPSSTSREIPQPDESVDPTLNPMPPVWSPFNLEGTECGMAGSAFHWAEGAGPSTLVPPGWEPEPRLTWEVLFKIYRCEKISWGHFERGPVHIMTEFHSNFTAPATCNDDSLDDINVLNAIWFDDPELVAYAKQELGMPAILGSFNATESDVGSIHHTTWTWTAEGGQPSAVSYYNFYPGNYEQTDLFRMVWGNATRLSYIDWEEQYTSDNYQGSITPGTLSTPMLYAEGETKPFTGLGELYDTLSFTAKISIFRDAQCEEKI